MVRDDEHTGTADLQRLIDRCDGDRGIQSHDIVEFQSGDRPRIDRGDKPGTECSRQIQAPTRRGDGVSGAATRPCQICRNRPEATQRTVGCAVPSEMPDSVNRAAAQPSGSCHW